MKFLTTVIAIFVILNSIGLVSFASSLLAHYDPPKQRKIILREVSFAFLILLMFTFIGHEVLKVMGVSVPVIGIVGGLLVFLVSFDMIFPKEKSPIHNLVLSEPYIVPIATPGLAGPGSMSTVMLLTSKQGPLLTSLSLFSAMVPSLCILLAAPFLKRVLGNRGMQALEKLSGMLVCCIGLQMIANGIIALVKSQFG